MGWTLATAREQPFEDILLLAADAIMEAEGLRSTTADTPQSQPGPHRTTQTVVYEAA